MGFRIISLIALLAASLACDRTPTLLDYPEYGDLRAAHPLGNQPPPILIVGTLGTDTLIKRPITSRWDPELTLALYMVHFNIESVISGDLPGSEADIYYFTIAMNYNGPRRLGSWNKGDRMLLSVRRDGGVIRMACDGVGSCARHVKTGFHPTLNKKNPTSVNDRLADLFLTKGEGVSDQQFAAALTDQESEYDFVTEREFGKRDPGPAIKKLQMLTTPQNSTVVKSSACDLLRVAFDKPCAAGIDTGAHKDQKQ